jgi:hypothetical protein
MPVYIEGFLAGETPLTVAALPAGRYRIVLKKKPRTRREERDGDTYMVIEEAYADSVHDVEIAAGKTARLSAKPAPTRSLSLLGSLREEDDWMPPVARRDERLENPRCAAKLRGYYVLEVSNFLAKGPDPIPPEHLYVFLPALARELDTQTEFRYLVTNHTRAPSPRWRDPKEGFIEPTVILSGWLAAYHRGPDGQARADCMWRLVEKKGGKVLLERLDSGSLDSLPARIAATIKDNW